MRPSEFLAGLWGTEPPGRVQLFRLRDRRCFYPQAVHACDYYADGQVDVYTCVALTDDRAVAGATRRTGRPTAQDARAIAGLWLDIDIDGGPAGKTGGAPTLDAATELAHSVTTPTVIVHSGHGIHAWYLFADGPWQFRTVDDQQAAATAARQWDQLHRRHAAEHGWGLDHTHDLARLLRLPGTLNGKSDPPAPVTVLHADRAMRKPRRDLLATAATAGPIDHPTSDPCIDVRVAAGAGLDQDRLALLLEDPDFHATFHHQRLRPNWSLSEYDLSLATQLAHMGGWTDQDIAAVITTHRLHHDPADRKHQRVDYLTRTIRMARTAAAAARKGRVAA